MIKNQLKIISFGDSLTVGYQSPTWNYPYYRETPYGEFLKEMLPENYTIIVSGISGELTSGMLERFDTDVAQAKPDYVAILGGANDIGWGIDNNTIHANLNDMYTAASSKGITPIAITVPSIRGFDALIPQRVELNKLIVATATHLNFPYIDLFTESAEPFTQRLKEVYSNDGLHLTTEGYKLIAEMLFNQVFNLLLK